MTEYDQQIALAKDQGWTKCRLTVSGAGAPERTPSPHGFPPGRNYEAPLPPYLHSLGAIHAVTRDFSLDETKRFSDHLKNIIQDEKCIRSAVDARYMTVNATAAQRTKAVLLMKGLWKD